MIDLDEILAEQGFRGRVRTLFVPKIYTTATINDFLEHRRDVETNSFLRSLEFTLLHLEGGGVLWNRTLIHLVSGLNKLSYTELSHNLPYIRLEDPTGILELPFLNRELYHASRVPNNSLIYAALILYDPHSDNTQLLHIEKDNDQKEEIDHVTVPAFAYAHGI